LLPHPAEIILIGIVFVLIIILGLYSYAYFHGKRNKLIGAFVLVIFGKVLLTSYALYLIANKRCILDYNMFLSVGILVLVIDIYFVYRSFKGN